MAGKATILSVSLPRALRTRLDREAARQQRSRSFIVAEAITQYLDRQRTRQFDEARERTLRETLALSPAERVRLSEELWRELTAGHEVAAPWTKRFDTFEEYGRWQRRGGAPSG
jgi:predicted transcriptional regulator